MQDNKAIINKMRVARNKKIYGRVLLTVNILQHKYEALADVYAALEREMTEQEYLEALDYLVGEGYIYIRDIADKAIADIADSDYRQLEGKVAPKGKRLLCGIGDDPMIEV